MTKLELFDIAKITIVVSCLLLAGCPSSVYQDIGVASTTNNVESYGGNGGSSY